MKSSIRSTMIIGHLSELGASKKKKLRELCDGSKMTFSVLYHRRTQ